jgi:diguanylate cyclase (GGDEF)-like protein
MAILGALTALGMRGFGAEPSWLLLALPLGILPFALLPPLPPRPEETQAPVVSADVAPLPHSDQTQGLFDHETETFGAQYLEPGYQHEMSRLRRSQAPMALLLLSVDCVELEQEHSHHATVHVVRVLAQILRRSLRGSDLICHRSAGEFAILLPETSPELASYPAIRILQAIQQWNEHSRTGYRIHPRLGLGDCWSGLEVALQQARQDRSALLLPSHPINPPLMPGSQAYI